MTRSLKVSKIENGTVIDHIEAGHALKILEVLDIAPGDGRTVSVAMNVESPELGQKDVIKIEDKQLETWEIESAALFAPQATLNIIEDYEVAEKKPIRLPDRVEGFLDCPNPACISNTDEPVEPCFRVSKEEPVVLKCHYCEDNFSYEELEIGN